MRGLQALQRVAQIAAFEGMHADAVKRLRMAGIERQDLLPVNLGLVPSPLVDGGGRRRNLSLDVAH